MSTRACGIISQARVGSTRLPGKVLKTLGTRSVLEHHLAGLSRAGLPVVVATTHEPDAERIHAICAAAGVQSFAGESEDVLSRYYHCAKEHGFQVVVRVTSDCPLIDGQLIRRGLEEYLARDDPELYLSNSLKRSFPRGFDFEIFSFELLERAFRLATDPAEREHVTPYLYCGKDPGIRLANVGRGVDASRYRVTLDTQDDLRLLERMVSTHGAHQMDAEGIITLLDTHPELVAINAHVEQKKLTLEEAETHHFRCLKTQRFTRSDLTLVPLRKQDLGAIKTWRNAQIDVLRQKRLLSDADQETYWTRVIAPSFQQEQPAQLLFSLLHRPCEDSQATRLIGYGGLVHLDWDAARAEVSFLLDPALAEDPEVYAQIFGTYLRLIQGVAFKELSLHRLTTETFDLREHHVRLLERANFRLEGRLRDHVRIGSRLVDSLLHGLLEPDAGSGNDTEDGLE